MNKDEQLLEHLQDLSDQASLAAAVDESARPYADFAAEMGLAIDPQSEG